MRPYPFDENRKKVIDSYLNWIYLDGKYVKKNEAFISIFDRGFLFGDSIYEVIPCYDGHFAYFDRHINRLHRSLQALEIEPPTVNWKNIAQELIDKNCNGNLMLYIQISRGCDYYRSHIYSPPKNSLTSIAFLQPIDFPTKEKMSQGASAITLDEMRWSKCYIKSNCLLPNSIAANLARKQNAQEAIFVKDHHVYEGSSSNIFMVKNSSVVTPPVTEAILNGITRTAVIELLKELNIPLIESNIKYCDFENADEIWVTSSVRSIMPITKLNEMLIGKGSVGPIWSKIFSYYMSEFKNRV